MSKKEIIRTVAVSVIGILAFAIIFIDYFYVVKKTEPGGGPLVSVTPTPTKPADGWSATKTVIIRSLAATSDSVTVTFSPVTGAAHYIISFRETGVEEWQEETTSETSFTFSADPRKEYQVKVHAVSSLGEAGQTSKISSVTTDASGLALAVDSTGITSVSLSWEALYEGSKYIVEYKETGENEWTKIRSDESSITISNLKKNTSYDFRVTSVDDTDVQNALSSIKTTSTLAAGFVDPFMNVYGTLNVGSQSKKVLITSADGCLGAKGWIEFDSKIYADEELKNAIGDIPSGMPLKVTADANNNYVYCASDNNWRVHVNGQLLDEEGNITGELTGWIEGCVMLVDLQDIFRSENNIYTLQYNRANAASSIFTTGGNVKRVDSSSTENTRYTPLNAASATASMAMGNYNLIREVTGKVLPNYGSRDQMPVIWDLALELITCQRNALENGYTLLIYDGYRPNATSRYVYETMMVNGYLSTTVNGRTLANGFLNTKLTEENYIAMNSNHNKGIAVDLTIVEFTTVDILGGEVVMQTKMHCLDFRANMRYNTSEANILTKIMTTDTGLGTLKGKQEWWHFELTEDTNRYPGLKRYIFSDYSI